MAQETINVGTTPNDNTGTLLRNAWIFVNSMMTEIYAKLFESGKVLSDNNYTDAEQTKLAALTDDVLEVANYAALPVTGETGIAYITLDTNLIYRWTGSAYVEISSGMTSQQIADLLKATVPTPTALTGEILLDRVNGRQYNTYDMASGALTFSIGASPTLFGAASGIIISDATTQPVDTAFAGVFGTYDNTNDAQNHWYVIYKYNASNALVAYLTWNKTT